MPQELQSTAGPCRSLFWARAASAQSCPVWSTDACLVAAMPAPRWTRYCLPARSMSAQHARHSSLQSLRPGAMWPRLPTAGLHSTLCRLQLLQLAGGGSPAGAMLLCEQRVLWSTLPHRDGLALHQLALAALLPACRSQGVGKRLAASAASFRCDLQVGCMAVCMCRRRRSRAPASSCIPAGCLVQRWSLRIASCSIWGHEVLVAWQCMPRCSMDPVVKAGCCAGMFDEEMHAGRWALS